jgi:AmmeMemoRadiSam system protein A
MDANDLGRVLLTIARSAIAERLDLPRAAQRRHAALTQPAATFVTLRQAEVLRGCIGSLEPVRSLDADVRANAVAAAFRDPRFPPLAAVEFETTSIEISLLSRAQRLAAPTEAGLVESLSPGIDGVILECDGRRATFLPQVWESIADPREFVAALKDKAGWPRAFWSPRMTAFRYTVTKWAERDLQAEAGAR